MSDVRQSGSPKQDQDKVPRIEVYWTAVSYRTVALYLLLIVASVVATLYVIRPDWYSNVGRRLTTALAAVPTAAEVAAQNQARFVNLDGKVEVKKVSSVNWTVADYRTTLDKGDLVRTAPDGAARVTFVDGTTYTIKSNSFVTVEENSIDRDRTTNVMVHISSGAVDLTTGTWDSPRSRAEVSFANARATLHENSRAAVQSDPTSDRHEITMSAGTADLQRGNQQVEIMQWERAAFTAAGPVTKGVVLAPPELRQPLNLEPLIEPDPRRATVHFGWSSVPDAVSYNLRISTNAMFMRGVVAEKSVTGTTADVSGLEAGDYFWTVTATDANKLQSAPSDPFKFTLATQGKGREMMLEVDSTLLHGNVVEIIGHTEPGAALIINGESVAGIRPDGQFRYFTQPLPRGSHNITVTGQNRRGGTRIEHVTIVIP